MAMFNKNKQKKKQQQKNQQNKKITVTVNSYVPKVKRIFDKKDLTNIGILFWNQDTLEELTKLSGPLAAANEYQVHYWSLVARQKFEDGSVMDIAFPTAIFNYDQEVTSAHIDFELKDVKEVSEAIKPVHNMVTNKLLPQLREIFKDVNVEFIEVPMNTMHRHPTGVASFSGTDLRKDHEEDTGIVFPLQSANEDPSFSSIIYNNPVTMVHSEYRIANGNTEEESGINYREGRCATYIKSSVSTPSEAEQKIGIKPIDTSYIVTKDPELQQIDLSGIIGMISYEPNTQFVKKENLIKPQAGEPILVYDADEKARIKKETNLNIQNFVDLQKTSMHVLKVYCLGLDRYYYQDQGKTIKEYETYTKSDLVDLALELQEEIYDEVYNTPGNNSKVEEVSVNDKVDEIPVLSDEDYYEFMGQQFSDEDEYYYTYGKVDSKAFEEKIKDLADTGMKERALHTASSETINRWHEELTQ